MSEIESLINSIVDQDFSKAAPTFAELIGDKLGDALEQEKVSMSDQVFNGVSADDDQEDDDIDLTDEELEAAAQEAVDDDDELEIEGHAV